MDTNNKTTRIAGLLYLVIVFCGFFYLRYVPVKLIDRGDMDSTIRNISSSQTLFRLGILVEIISNFVFLLLALTFYKLFQQISKTHALLLLLFVVIGIVMSFVNLQNKFDVITLVNRAADFKTLTPGTLKDQVLLYIDFYRDGVVIQEIFWGLWLFPLGVLIIKSGFLPKFIGILLIIGCFGYLIDFAGSFFSARYNESVIANYVTMPASLGELFTCLWLLIQGAKKDKVTFATSDKSPLIQ